MQTIGFAVLAFGILAFGLVSGRVRNSILTPPMAFVAFGCLVSEHGLGLLDLHLDGALVHALAEITLVLVLFGDAARIDLALLRRQHDLPVRLLSIGLPLTIVAGTLAGVLLLPGLSFWEAALLAAILAPTDAALGQAVVSSPKVPVRIRQALNVESGLNDGIALPVVLVLFSIACATSQAADVGYWVRFALLQVTLGPAVGAAVGWLGGRTVDVATDRGWMDETFHKLAALGLALLAFSVAELVGGNGFIAAFVAGLVIGNTARSVCAIEEFAEVEGQLLTLLVFLVFGAMLVPEALHRATGRTVAYAIASLTLVRMVPVALALLGKRLRLDTIGFLAWFGPRGIASILFALLVVEREGGAQHEGLMPVIMLTVLGSVILHGITAAPWANAYARRLAAADEDHAEHDEVPAMPLRHG